MIRRLLCIVVMPLFLAGCYDPMDGSLCHWANPACADEDFDGDGVPNGEDGCPQDANPDIQCGPGCKECPGSSSCHQTANTSECTCEPGHTGTACDTCDTGYQDNDGNGMCFPDCATSGLDCGLYGTCDDSGGTAVCFCDYRYNGTECDTCAAGYQDNDGDGTCLPDCSAQDCSGHGTCDDSSGTVECVCDAGYQDNDGNGTCQANCATSGLDCGLQGTCDDISGEAVCACDDGWGGPGCSVEVVGIEWVAILGGTFMMGSDYWQGDGLPVHHVSIPAFEMTRTEVMVAQYQACVDDEACTEPDQSGSYHNWGVAGHEYHPVNCVDWFQAVDFCSWMGGRLPSEAEWEYAARGGGQDITYPWGDEWATCDRAVMFDGVIPGCYEFNTWVVCSRPAGDTAQGLCDMAGNVEEWVQDWYHGSYDCDANPDAENCGSGGIAPSDGGAWETPGGSGRVIRGGSFQDYAEDLRAASRSYCDPSATSSILGTFGFRCARDAP